MMQQMLHHKSQPLQVKVLGKTTQSVPFLQFLFHYAYYIIDTGNELFIPGVKSGDAVVAFKAFFIMDQQIETN